MKKAMRITDANQIAHDGQHQHGHQYATLEVGDEALHLVARHLKHSGCMPMPFKPTDLIPLQFTMNNDLTGKATVICGICKKELGTCNVIKVKDK